MSNSKRAIIIIVVIASVLAVAVVSVVWLKVPRTLFQPTYLPQGISIKDAYTYGPYASDSMSSSYSAFYDTTDPSMTISSYRSDDGSILQLNCSQYVQDQTCTQKVTQKGLTYFVFDSLNSALNTHSVRVKATINSKVIDISIEPPLTTTLNETYDWSKTLDSMIFIDPSRLPRREPMQFNG